MGRVLVIENIACRRLVELTHESAVRLPGGTQLFLLVLQPGMQFLYLVLQGVVLLLEGGMVAGCTQSGSGVRTLAPRARTRVRQYRPLTPCGCLTIAYLREWSQTTV
jgi:hypothetical protein